MIQRNPKCTVQKSVYIILSPHEKMRGPDTQRLKRLLILLKWGGSWFTNGQITQCTGYYCSPLAAHGKKRGKLIQVKVNDTLLVAVYLGLLCLYEVYTRFYL